MVRGSKKRSSVETDDL